MQRPIESTPDLLSAVLAQQRERREATVIERERPLVTVSGRSNPNKPASAFVYQCAECPVGFGRTATQIRGHLLKYHDRSQREIDRLLLQARKAFEP